MFCFRPLLPGVVDEVDANANADVDVDCLVEELMLLLLLLLIANEEKPFFANVFDEESVAACDDDVVVAVLLPPFVGGFLRELAKRLCREMPMDIRLKIWSRSGATGSLSFSLSFSLLPIFVERDDL